MKKRILYVEDERDQAETVIWRLRRLLDADWTIDYYSDFTLAMTEVKANPIKWVACFFDLDLRDRREENQMKGVQNLDGVLLAKEVKRGSPFTPVILVSASVEEDDPAISPEVLQYFDEFIDKLKLKNSAYTQARVDGLGDELFRTLLKLGLVHGE